MHPFLGGLFCFLVKVGSEWGIVGERKEEGGLEERPLAGVYA